MYRYKVIHNNTKSERLVNKDTVEDRNNVNGIQDVDKDAVYYENNGYGGDQKDNRYMIKSMDKAIKGNRVDDKDTVLNRYNVGVTYRFYKDTGQNHRKIEISVERYKVFVDSPLQKEIKSNESMRSEKGGKPNETLRLNRLFMFGLQKRKVPDELNSRKSIITGRTKKVLTRTMKNFKKKLGEC